MKNHIKRLADILLKATELIESGKISGRSIILYMLSALPAGVGMALHSSEKLCVYAFLLYAIAVLLVLPIIIEIYNKWNK